MSFFNAGSAILTLVWVMGIVLAKGFWPTFWAIVIPPWAWYLAVEHFMQYFGVL